MAELFNDPKTITIQYQNEDKMWVRGMLKKAPAKRPLFDNPVVLFISKRKPETKNKRPIIFDKTSIVDWNTVKGKIDTEVVFEFEVYKNRASSRRTPTSNNTQDTIEDAYKAPDTKYSYTPTRHNGYSDGTFDI